MHHLLGAMVVGTCAGESVRSRSPRPLAKAAIRTWLKVVRETRRRTLKLRAETAKLVDEARAELDREETQE